MPFLLLFSLFTLLDFVVLFAVGSRIDLLVTLLLVLATGFVGLYLIRQEGTATLARARLRLAQGELPSDELLTGAALIFGGALLLAPGFLSDALGLLCVVPKARRLLARGLALLNLRLSGMAGRPSGQHGTDGWSEAGKRDRDLHDADRESHRGGSEHEPLEGDYISHDEPRRR
ncbi:FxsA family protein [Billgrantia pellis]|uniref:FxsA family protein n=1 Tax=Billgrantia pellis TaxID=2606936 RepID=A0A7V7KHQ0_9GAMM|nr:FxsA family protein [Halomonas pellis]KAA0013746.1 FxsA family protein [Halomonas pellis]